MRLEHLKNEWFKLAEEYFEDVVSIEEIWQKIVENYSEKNRYYHNLNHISAMLDLANENRSAIINYDELLFAIWFHDIIYKSTSKKNEVKSADFTKSILIKATKKEVNIDRIYQLIIATKSHQIILNHNQDNAFLLDFDLSILAKDWDVYQTYIQNIRKEYKIYPDFLYHPARKKVLASFLERKQLYFTAKYQNLFEEKARENLRKEIDLL